MIDYRLKISLLSPLRTRWQSDTLFGHLVWMTELGACDISTDQLLGPFQNGECPFVFSDGFPEGLMPRPMIYEKREYGFSVSNDAASYSKTKSKRKAAWVNYKDFIKLINGFEMEDEIPDDPWLTHDQLHASLDRRTLRTGGEGGAGTLYSTVGIIMKKTPARLDIYLRSTDESWGLRAIELLRALSKYGGYGSDRSIGYGQFLLDETEKLGAWYDVNDKNGFVSLSSYVPAENDPVNGAWRVRIKRGKLGEPSGKINNPFKKPLIQLEPGAVFRTNSQPKPWYGRLVEGLSLEKPAAVQAGYTIAIPATLH